MPVRTQPKLHVDADTPGLRGVGISVHGLAPDQMTSLRKHVEDGGAHAVLGVDIVRPPSSLLEDLPGIAGYYEVLETGMRFLPAFPFQRRTLYRAIFRPRVLECFSEFEDHTIEFSFEAAPHLPAPEILAIYPSGNELPANLLRFYVVFSTPMRRGLAKAAISLVGADGRPVADSLYNAPVELWDRSMTCLTVLLDPGRLKRGVGPNSALGPPLAPGEHYALVVGAGMADASGGLLAEPVAKRFRVAEAVRSPVAIDRWRLAPVAAGTRATLVLSLPDALDWSLLSDAITVETMEGCRIGGDVTVDGDETRWAFTPKSSWVAGWHRLRVAPGLEDPCGNTRDAPFDRPLRSGPEMRSETASLIPFCVV